MIRNSPSEIYHYALPFAPSSSWLRRSYSTELSQEVKVVTGLQADWGACFRTVSFNHIARALACQKDLIAVGLDYGNIFILDAITGSQVSVLPGHSSQVGSLAFSLDATFLVSGGDDRTVKLWDIQTGAAIRIFNGHTSQVHSVSISPDGATIASGSQDSMIYLWDVQIGECHCVIKGHNGSINSVEFSPTNSQLLISASDDHTLRWWDTNGYQIGPGIEGDHVVLSSDGSHFVSWREKVATVQSSDSGVVITFLQLSSGQFGCCQFSPDGKFVAGSSNHAIYVWDITSPNTCLIKTFTGHVSTITSLAFPSSIISLSRGGLIKFWETRDLSTEPVADSEPLPLASAPVMSLTLQANNGIAISSDSIGVVKIWDISTGLCKASFHTPAQSFDLGDVRLIDGRLVFVWCLNGRIHIWDPEKGEHPTVDVPSSSQTAGLRILGDGSKVILLDNKSICAWSIQTGEVVGNVRFKGKSRPNFFMVDGSKVWVCFEDLQTWGWDFGTAGSAPIPLSNVPPDRPRLGFIDGTMERPINLPRIEDTATGAEVFRLCGRYAKPTRTWWDGRYLLAGYDSGEVLILDFIQLIP